MKAPALIIKLKLILVIVFFSTSCGRGNDKKVQKSAAFAPVCKPEVRAGIHYTSLVKCLSGSPACGTLPGSGEPQVYCIDDGDRKMSQGPCCAGEQGKCSSSSDSKPYCALRIDEESHKTTIQKNTFFAPVCEPGLVVDCPVFSNPACGTTSGASTLHAYCINSQDEIVQSVRCAPTTTQQQASPSVCKKIP